MKSANVTVRVEPDVKEKAEAILSELGIPTSTAINMFYRQIVLWNGLPFRPAKPPIRPLSRDEMTDEVFNARMAESTSRRPAGSSMAVASSRTMHSGAMAMTPAMATRCFCPPPTRRRRG